tara:strand:- start:3724 stop:6366 length:2643 start_codon:yes stop_codon:yes gene_type:complete
MAVLSSLLGIGQQQPVAGPAIATTAFPAELAPYYKDILSKSQALYEDRTAEGYQPYQGPTMAEFTPEQQQAFTGIAGLAGQQAPKFAEAEQLTRQAAAPIATADIEQFMNPYQQAVVDIEKREAQKQFEQKTLPSIRAAQVAQGSFGGTRGTLLEAQTLAEQDRLLSDIQARGSQQAYNQALQQAQAQRAREGQAGAQLATMAPQAFKAQLGELGAVQTVGEEKQRQAQTALNEAYKQFIEERQFPQQSLGQYQAVVQAQPASQMLETVQYAPPPPPLGQQLLGGLGTLVGTYGAFGGFSPGGLFGKSAKTGGGISGLPVIKRQSGSGFMKDLQLLKPYLSGFTNLGPMAKGVYDTVIGDPLSTAVTKGKQYFTEPGSGGIFSKTDPQGSAKIKALAGVQYPDPTREEELVGKSPAQQDVMRIKDLYQEATGEVLDIADFAGDVGAKTYNKAISAINKYFRSNLKPMDTKGDSLRQEVADLTGMSQIGQDKKIRDIISSRPDIQKGIIPFLAETGGDVKEAFNNFIKSVDSDKSKVDSLKETANKLKSKLPDLKDDEQVSSLGETETDDKAIVTQKTDKGNDVVTAVKPEKVNEQQVKDVKNKQKQLGTKIKDLKNDPTNTEKKTSLQTARDDYLAALRKQKDDLGKQQSNIDDSRRKSMFEFLAKVSSKYGQGATLPEAAASELDSAASRTRQLDQAALDLKNKQREADLTVSKEKLSQEEKKAAAKVEADKAKLEDKRKGQELYIKYMKAQNEGASKLKMPNKNNIKQQKKLLKPYFNVDSISDIRENFGGDIPIGALGNVNAENATTALNTLFEDSRFQTDFYNEFKNYKQTDVDTGEAIKDIVKKLVGSGNYKFDTEKQTILFGKVPFGTKNVIKN